MNDLKPLTYGHPMGAPTCQKAWRKLKEKEAELVRLVDHLHWSGLSAGARSLIEKRIDSINCEIAILKKDGVNNA